MRPGGGFKGGGRERWRAVGWPLAAALALWAVGWAAFPFTVDDAFIVARYATHLAHGQGYVMNVGGPATDGITGPLWVLPMVAGVPWAKGIGLACMVAAAALAVATAQARCGAWGAAAAAAFVAAQPTLGIWAGAGLETGPATLALVGATVAALRRPAPAGGAAAVALCILPWLRPEAVPAGLVAAAIIAQRDRPAGLRAFVGVALGLGSVVSFRWMAFGNPLPLAIAAKPSGLAEGVPYVARAVLATTGLVALVPAVVAAVRGGSWARAVAAIAGVHLLAVAVAGGDWMPGYRLVAPALPLVAMLVGAGIARWRAAPWLRAAALALCVAVPLADLAVEVPRARAAGLRRQRVGAPFAAWLGERYASLAVVDAGYLPWASGTRVFDLAGLTDPAVARAPGGHLDKRFDLGLLAGASPDAIVLHSARPPGVDSTGRLTRLWGYPVERRVAASGWVRAHYRVRRTLRYAPGYYYVVLAR